MDFNIQKMKIMASGPITSSISIWEIDSKPVLYLKKNLYFITNQLNWIINYSVT